MVGARDCLTSHSFSSRSLGSTGPGTSPQATYPVGSRAEPEPRSVVKSRTFQEVQNMKYRGMVFSVLTLATLAWAQISLARRAPNSLAEQFSNLPASARASISAAIGRDNFEYRLRPSIAGFHAGNAQQKLEADFTSKGLELSSKG